MKYSQTHEKEKRLCIYTRNKSEKSYREGRREERRRERERERERESKEKDRREERRRERKRENKEKRKREGEKLKYTATSIFAMHYKRITPTS